VKPEGRGSAFAPGNRWPPHPKPFPHPAGEAFTRNRWDLLPTSVVGLDASGKGPSPLEGVGSSPGWVPPTGRSSAAATTNKPMRSTLKKRMDSTGAALSVPCPANARAWDGRVSTGVLPFTLCQLSAECWGTGLCWNRGERGAVVLRPLPRCVWPSRLGTTGGRQGQGYCRDRGEILGPRQEHQMRRRLAGWRSPIKNESEKIQDDQIPLSFSTVNDASKVPGHPSSLDGVAGCLSHQPRNPKPVGSGGSIVARSKLKGIDGMTPPGVGYAA